MSKKGKIRVALGSMLALTLVVTCAAVYQSGSKSTPNEKEFVKENEEDTVDQAIRTEERVDTEETEDVNTSQVEGTRKTEDDTEEEEKQDTVSEEQPAAEKEVPEQENTESASAQAQTQTVVPQAPSLNFTESSLMEWPVNGQVVLCLLYTCDAADEGANGKIIEAGFYTHMTQQTSEIVKEEMGGV